jgi:hypothetical protein
VNARPKDQEHDKGEDREGDEAKHEASRAGDGADR